MYATPPTARKSPCPSDHAGGDETHGYHSASGEFNYYPTSAHRRRDVANGMFPREAPAALMTDDGLCKVDVFYETDEATMPHKSVSKVSQSASPRMAVASSAATPAGEMRVPSPHICVTGRAPLLHRYRTAQTNMTKQPPARDASSAVPASLPHFTSKAALGKKTTPNIRRSLLHTCRAAAPKSRSPDGRDVADLSPAFAETGNHLSNGRDNIDTTPVQPRPARSASGPNSESKVPVTHVRLTVQDASRADSQSASPATRGSDVSSKTRTLTKGQADSRESPRSFTARAGETTLESTEKSNVAEATLDEDAGLTPDQARMSSSHSSSHVVDALLSKEVTSSRCCEDVHCMHIERSISEFILMQRELRRCYAVIEDYVVVVSELREECDEACAAQEELRQKYARQQEEMQAQTRALREAPTRHSEKSTWTDVQGITGVAATSCAPGADECLASTWRETAEELRRALRKENAAHEATRQELEKTKAVRDELSTRVLDLEDELEYLLQHLEAASHSHVGPVAKDESVRLACHPNFQDPLPCHCQEHHTRDTRSSMSSPTPRLHSPPKPHQSRLPPPPLPQAEAEAEASNADLSAISALSEETALGEGSTNSDQEKEAESAQLHEAHSQVENDSGISNSSSVAPRAVGSGAVRIEPSGQRGEGRRRASTSCAAKTEPQKQGGYPLSSPKQPSSHTQTTNNEDLHEKAQHHPDAQSTAFHWPTNASLDSLFAKLDAASQEQIQSESPFPFPAATPNMFKFPKLPSASLPVREDANERSPELEIAERKCQELLRALLDKEQQLAVVAEERTKYQRAYEQHVREAT